MLTNKQQAKILIVDDYQPNLLALRVTLDSPQYELFEVESGSEAIKLCKEHEFALIILDVQMPTLDGFQTARLIKDCEFNGETPIIFVTAVYKEDPFVKKGYEAGAIDYFGKPFDPSVLKAKVGIYTELYLKTKRLEETKALLKSHDQVKTLLDAIPIGLMITDKNGQIIETNSEASRIWVGIRKCSVSDFGVYKGWWPDSGEQLKSEEWAIERTLKSGTAYKDEIVNIECFDGSRKAIINSAFPFRDANGSIVGAVSVFQEAPQGSFGDGKWKAWLTLLSS